MVAFFVFEISDPLNGEIFSCEDAEWAVKTFSTSLLKHKKYTVKYPFEMSISAVKLQEKQKVVDFKVLFAKIDGEPTCEQ